MNDRWVRDQKIITYHWAKPIPVRHFDWEAVTDDYDGAPDSPLRGQIGYGTTEQEAIDDLKRLLQEEAEYQEDMEEQRYRTEMGEL
jgi:hypothetical protein